MKKNQHYVPQLYLKYFADKNKSQHEDKFLWVFEGPTVPPYRKSPKNLCVKKYFYSFDDDELLPDHDLIENYLNGIETSTAKILNDLWDKKTEFVDIKKRMLLARFISFLHFRTVQSREFLRILFQNKLKSHFVDEINKLGGYREWINRKPELSISEEDFLDSFNKIKISPKKALSTEIMLEWSLKMIPFLVERNWSFYVPEDTQSSFVTSDHPVNLYNEDFGPDMIPGIALEKTDFVFPVNPRLCLIATFFAEERTITVSKDFVIGINRFIANKSYRYVFGNTNDFTALFGVTSP